MVFQQSRAGLLFGLCDSPGGGTTGCFSPSVFSRRANTRGWSVGVDREAISPEDPSRPTIPAFGLAGLIRTLRSGICAACAHVSGSQNAWLRPAKRRSASEPYGRISVRLARMFLDRRTLGLLPTKRRFALASLTGSETPTDAIAASVRSCPGEKWRKSDDQHRRGRDTAPYAAAPIYPTSTHRCRPTPCIDEIRGPCRSQIPTIKQVVLTRARRNRRAGR